MYYLVGYKGWCVYVRFCLLVGGLCGIFVWWIIFIVLLFIFLLCVFIWGVLVEKIINYSVIDVRVVNIENEIEVLMIVVVILVWCVDLRVSE